MGYNIYDSRSERDREKREESDSYLRSIGFVRDEYGHYNDPNNVTRTGAWIGPDGRINMDM